MRQFREFGDADFIYGDVHQGPNLKEKKLRKGRQSTFYEMLKTLHVPVPQQSAIWKRRIYEELGGLEENWQVLLDREYFLRISQNFKIKYLPGPMAFFRNHLNSKSVRDELKWIQEIPLLYKNIFENNKYNLSQIIIGKKQNYYANAYLYCSMIAERAEDNKLQKTMLMNAKKNSLNKYLVFNFKHFLYRFYKTIRWH